MPAINDWFYWALLSAIFAALTAIFAKIGLEGVDSDYATLLRTFVSLLCSRVLSFSPENGAIHFRSS